MSEPIATLPKSGILINWPMIDEIDFTVGFLKSAIPAYKLGALTNGHLKNEIQVVDAHPIAVLETMQDKAGDNQSRLPLIGVEQVNISPAELTLGVNQSSAYKVTEEFIARLDAIPEGNKMFPKDFTTQLRALLAGRNGRPLFIFTNSVTERTAIQVSAWSSSSESNRYIKKALKSIMIEYYRAIQKFGVKPERYSMTPNLYNFDYGETMYGTELEMPFLMQNMNYIIDIDLTELKHFDIGIYDSEAWLFDAEHISWFTVSGAKDRLGYGLENLTPEPV